LSFRILKLKGKNSRGTLKILLSVERKKRSKKRILKLLFQYPSVSETDTETCVSVSETSVSVSETSVSVTSVSVADTETSVSVADTETSVSVYLKLKLSVRSFRILKEYLECPSRVSLKVSLFFVS